MEGQKIQAEGQLERAGGTRHQYGSHILFAPRRRDIRYILKSDTVQLRDFEGQRVQVTGSVAEDDALNEGDPTLLDVLAVMRLEEE